MYDQTCDSVINWTTVCQLQGGKSESCHLLHCLGGGKRSSPADKLSPCSQSYFPWFGDSPSPHIFLPLQTLPSLAPFELILKALFKASHKGFHNVFQQEPLDKKNPLLYYPSWKMLFQCSIKWLCIMPRGSLLQFKAQDGWNVSYSSAKMGSLRLWNTVCGSLNVTLSS